MTETQPLPRQLARPVRGLLAWLPVLAACTLVLWSARGVLDEAHIVLAYLLVVLAGSTQHGRIVGYVLAVFAFFAFNFFLLPPLYTLKIGNPLDWWILAAFLITGAVAAQLLHRAQRAQILAEGRAREIDRLSSLGAESLSVPSAVEAVTAIARVVAAELGVAFVEIVRVDPGGGLRSVAHAGAGTVGAHANLVGLAARDGCLVGVSRNGAPHFAAPDAGLATFLVRSERLRSVLVPLRVRGRTIGVLHLNDPGGVHLDTAGVAFATTLMYYAALAVERARLAEEAEQVTTLREADRLKDALVASVSHDLRTPLTTIRAVGAEIRATGDERAAVIEDEAERLDRVVTDLLDISRIQAGGLPMTPEIVAADDLVGSALQRVAGLSGADLVEVRFPQEDGSLLGHFDFVQSLRALVNVLENALRHGGSAHPVLLEVREEGENLVFRVMDRGPGVAPEDRERIFEPFFRARHPERTQLPGTGLGLAIARSLTEAQGGSVRYRPRAGGGSIFEILLPRAPDPGPAEPVGSRL